MSIEVILLGTSQDGGLPQAGCQCSQCLDAHSNPAQRRYVVSLGIISNSTKQYWMIDATPDFREQLALLQSKYLNYNLAGIFLTHAHMGHYAGLLHLGREAMNSVALPVYASQGMEEYLTKNHPWTQLIENRNVIIRRMIPEQEVVLSPYLQITPLLVPHRDEWSDALAFILCGLRKKLFYCPDIDSWDAWKQDIRSFIEEMDIALLDATFFSADELPSRDLSKIPHPLATDTAQRLAGVSCEVRLIHLNHSNPLHRLSPELDWLENQGLGVGIQGESWGL